MESSKTRTNFKRKAVVRRQKLVELYATESSKYEKESLTLSSSKSKANSKIYIPPISLTPLNNDKQIKSEMYYRPNKSSSPRNVREDIHTPLTSVQENESNKFSKKSHLNEQLYKNLVNLNKNFKDTEENLMAEESRSERKNDNSTSLYKYKKNLDLLRLDDYNKTKKIQEDLLFNINKKLGYLNNEMNNIMKRESLHKTINEEYLNRMKIDKELYNRLGSDL